MNRLASLLAAPSLIVIASLAAGCDMATTSATSPDAAAPANGSDLPTASPESMGYSSAQLAALTPYAASIHAPAGMVLVGGKVIYQWGDTTAKAQVHSIRKSFLSSLYGLEVARGTISLSSTLQQLGIDDVAPSLTIAEQQATVQDLIESRSGVYHVANYETASEVANRPARGSHPPGTFWYYNNWDFNAAGGIYEQATGRTIFDAFAQEIATPIGMQDYSPADGSYEEVATVSKWPAYLFDMSTRDMARFGQLYMQAGQWNGTQVVPANWIAESLHSYSDVPTFPGQGYGYLWWIAETGAGLFNHVDVGGGAFAAEGSGGHYIAVLPAYDMVIVSRADDAWYESDEADNNIGPNRMGELVSIVLGAKTSS